MASYLKRGLSQSGFVVDIARDGIDGRHMALEGNYDLIVLDVMLPGLDGFEVLAAVRERKNTPVLMLSGRNAVEDRVRGLQTGADDYMVKPFSFCELVARIDALLRRGGKDVRHEPTVFKVGSLEVDLARRRTVREGRRLQLTALEFALLGALLRKQGEVVPRGMLTEQVWDMNFDGDSNVVDVAVRRLRAKIDDPFEQKLLHTVRGMGYVIDVRDDEEAG